MRVHGLVSSLLFGVGAALTLAFSVHLLGPRVGFEGGLAIHWAAALVVYAAMLAEGLRGALRNALVAVAGAALVLAFAAGTTGVALGLTVVLAGVRTGLVRDRDRVRAMIVEGGLGLSALGFAAWLGGPGVLGAALSLWGYALVQSLYFVVPRRSAAGEASGQGDPFERARERLIALLDEA